MTDLRPGQDEVVNRTRTRAAIDVEISSRIAAAPADAEVRGILFQMIEDGLRVSDAASASYHAAFPGRHRAYAMYPLRAYLQRVHFAGDALGPTVREGIARCHARATEFVLSTPAAKLITRGRARDPLRMLERLESSRALFMSYGSWRVHGRRGDVSMVVRDEYAFIDAAWVPAIASVFPACALPPAEIDVDLDGPYSGRLRVRW